MQFIPLQTIPNQAILTTLGTDDVQINVYQKTTGMFLDLYLDGTLLLSGVLCRNLTPLVMSRYLGFPGDLCWYDTQGSSDPVYTGLGTRWALVWLEPADLPSQMIFT
jgi:hypothetical protein